MSKQGHSLTLRLLTIRFQKMPLALPRLKSFSSLRYFFPWGGDGGWESDSVKGRYCFMKILYSLLCVQQLEPHLTQIKCSTLFVDGPFITFWW